MTRIKIISDSTADITKELEALGVTVLPLTVLFGEEGYRDGVDITASEFYAKMREFGGFPTTSLINPGVFTKAYEKLVGEYDVIISIHLSSKLSGTFNSAMIAAQEVEGIKVLCYDSESVTLGLGFLVKEAARAVQEGCSPEEVIQRLDQVKETLSLYFAVPSLDHLEKGGRIGKASAILGTLLNIVPLLTLVDGVVTPAEKIRGKKKVNKRIVELIGESMTKFGGKENLVLSILHTDNLEGAKELAELAKTDLGVEDFRIDEVGPVIGTHVGPGVIAAIFHKKIS